MRKSHDGNTNPKPNPIRLRLRLTRPVLRFRNAVWGNESFRLRVVEERSLMLNLHKNCGEANPKPKPKP